MKAHLENSKKVNFLMFLKERRRPPDKKASRQGENYSFIEDKFHPIKIIHRIKKWLMLPLVILIWTGAAINLLYIAYSTIFCLPVPLFPCVFDIYYTVSSAVLFAVATGAFAVLYLGKSGENFVLDTVKNSGTNQA